MDLHILKVLNEQSVIKDSRLYCQQNNINHDEFVGHIKSLEADLMISTKIHSIKINKLTDEGLEIVRQEISPEVLLFNQVPTEGKINSTDLEKKCGENKMDSITFQRALGTAMKNKWIGQEKDKVSKTIYVFRKTQEVKDETFEVLKKLKDGEKVNEKSITNLKKRKLVKQETEKTFEITKGETFALERRKPATDLTAEMIQTGSWKNEVFKNYNFNAAGKKLSGGHLHPLLKVRSEFREIFLEMGFEEMQTNNFVESSFWNFDSLFQPQQHPARDAHDTFFLKNPAECQSMPNDYLQKVKDVHEKGGYGSIGYQYDWKIEEAKKNLLRTHTTAVSSRYLYKLSQIIKKEGFKPKKYFSIDRVFRNEVVDATHLCEFHQVEGMVIGKNLSLGDLIGTLNTFFSKIGIHKLRFKPAYNPYTEPSMEIFGYHPILKKWIEVGNSGVFRPEMLLPMGLPEDVTVLAWGLSLERPTMIKYNIREIKELVGHKVSIKKIQSNPICYMER